MANGELLTELVRAHYQADHKRFSNVLSQLISAESRSGHLQIARKLRELREAETSSPTSPSAVPMARASRDLADLLEVSYSKSAFTDLIISDPSASILRQYVREQHLSEVLASHGLRPRRKLLLHGPPGTGKTMTALVLAGEMKLPLARVRLELLFSRLLGETAAALTEIFAEASRLKAVYLFDEFDALGRARESGGDVGEIRRVVGTFLQLLDADESESIFIAATNLPGSIDKALMRRFDDVIEFSLPSIEETVTFLKRRLRGHGMSPSELRRIAEDAKGLSLADLGGIVDSSRKAALLDGDANVKVESIKSGVDEYLSRYGTFGQAV